MQGIRPAILSRIVILLLLGVLQASAQTPCATGSADGPQAEFHMARLIYRDSPEARRGYGMWAIDYPAAEFHIIQGIRRLTRVDTADDSIHLSLSDDRIFDFPWLFAQQVGTWYLNDFEARRLREYLDRGGFLVADDFHGSHDWVIFYESIRRVFPDRPIINMTEGDPILHIFYDLNQRTQIPGRRHLVRLPSGEIGAQMQGVQSWKGIYDDNGRLMVAINYNMDMGDAWEHADDPVYPEPMTALAYKFGINYLIYGMTH